MLYARKLAHTPGTTVRQRFDAITKMYRQQANLNHRTTQSILFQQYSTPAPVAYMAGVFCGFGTDLEDSTGPVMPRNEASVFNDGGNPIAIGFDNPHQNSNFEPIKITKHEIKNIISGNGGTWQAKAIKAAASNIGPGTQASAGSHGTQLEKWPQDGLRQYIENNNLWVPVSYFDRYLGSGAEHDVYLLDSENVVKTNNLSFYAGSMADYFDNLLLHNYFFAATAYELVGFTQQENEIRPVVKQRFVEKTQDTDLHQVKKWLADNGFANTKNDDYHNAELGIILEDLHEDNVYTMDGILYFVDTVFYIKANTYKAMADGGPTDAGKMYSASSRFRPSEIIAFEPAIVGPNGAKLISYTWAYEWTMKPNFEGELVSKRISDWTQADLSADTGRDVVHKFTVERTDGTLVNVSSESVPILLGYVDREQMKALPSIVSAVKTLAKQRMKLAIMKAQKAEYDQLVAKFEAAPKPPIEYLPPSLDNLPFAQRRFAERDPDHLVEYSWFRMGDITDRQESSHAYSSEGKSIFTQKTHPTPRTIDNLTSTWVRARVAENGGKYPQGIYDLERRVERQERKVEQATGSRIRTTETMHDGGAIDFVELKEGGGGISNIGSTEHTASYLKSKYPKRLVEYTVLKEQADAKEKLKQQGISWPPNNAGMKQYWVLSAQELSKLEQDVNHGIEEYASGFAKIYIRIGLPPMSKDKKITNSTGQSSRYTSHNEQGVSVFEAGYDPLTKMVVVHTGGSSLTMDWVEGLGQKRQIYLIEGTEADAEGYDGEPLLVADTVNVIGEIDPDMVVTDISDFDGEAASGKKVKHPVYAMADGGNLSLPYKAYLMPLDRYLQEVVPIIKEYKKFLKQHEKQFLNVGYGGANVISYPEALLAAENKVDVDPVSMNFSKEHSWETNQQRVDRLFAVKEKEVPQAIIDQKNGYYNKLVDIFGKRFADFASVSETDLLKSNKRSIKWAIDYNDYATLLESGEIGIEQIEPIAESAGVKLPKKLYEYGKGLDLSRARQLDELYKSLPYANREVLKGLVQTIDTDIEPYAQQIAASETKRYKELIAEILAKPEIELEPLVTKIEFHKKIFRFNKSESRTEKRMRGKYGMRDTQVAYYLGPSLLQEWEQNLATYVAEYIKKLKAKLYQNVLDNFSKITSVISSIKTVSIRRGSKGFQGTFRVTFAKGGSFDFVTEAIGAGGYNIQQFHFRYIHHFNGVTTNDGKFLGTASMLDILTAFGGEADVMQDGGTVKKRVPKDLDLDLDIHFGQKLKTGEIIVAHSTSSNLLPGILKHGLKADSEKVWQDSSKGKLFFEIEPTNTYYGGNVYGWKAVQQFGGIEVTLYVKISKDKLKTDRDDAVLGPNYVKNQRECNCDVPPEDILGLRTLGSIDIKPSNFMEFYKMYADDKTMQNGGNTNEYGETGHKPWALEASAGNGMLTIAGLPKDFVVNELDKVRNAHLQAQGYAEVTKVDASEPFPESYQKHFKAVITNPPFGSVDKNLKVRGMPITKLEHLMAAYALECMRDDGRCAIIIGGNTKYTADGIVSAGADRNFLTYLHYHYNVADLVNIDGSLYSRMGTSFNVRLILINGRKPSKEPGHKLGPDDFPPPMLDDYATETFSANPVKSFDEFFERMEKVIAPSPQRG